MQPGEGLGPGLAQRIVETSMERLGHNVNVMDPAGVIVGSGDPGRLGEVHEGALLAMRGRRTVAVDAAMTERISGVRPGVNLPLMVAGRVVGAVGVTGDPVALAEVGELLRMAAELMVEQAGALDDEQWRASQLGALARALVEPDADPVVLAGRASGLGTRVDTPRWVLLLTPTATAPAEAVREARRALHRTGLDVVTALLSPTLLLALVPRTADVDDVSRRLGRSRAQVELVCGGWFGAGLPGDGLDSGFASAQDVLATRPRGGADAVVHRWSDDPFTALVGGMPDDWRGEQLEQPWRRLAAADTSGVLRRTVVTYLQTGGDLPATALRLSVHRNTLRNRLERISQLGGADLRDPRGAAHLMIGAVRRGALCMRTDRDAIPGGD